MSPGHRGNASASEQAKPLIFLVEDDPRLRALLRDLLERNDLAVEEYSSAEDFLAVSHPLQKSCLLLDVGLPGPIGGMDLLRRLKERKCYIPTMFITGSRTVKMAIECMKLGAVDFVQKPIEGDDLVRRINDALGQKCWRCESFAPCHGAAEKPARLTPRQRQIMELMMSGQTAKSVSSDLGINQRTVEKHRGEIMKRLDVTSIFALTQLLSAASGMGFCGYPIPGRGGPVGAGPQPLIRTLPEG